MDSTTTLPGGVTQTCSLDGLLQLQDLQVQSRTDTANGISSTNSRSFGYDDEVRLIRVQTTAPSSDIQTYTLDAVGNRIAHSRVSMTPTTASPSAAVE